MHAIHNFRLYLALQLRCANPGSDLVLPDKCKYQYMRKLFVARIFLRFRSPRSCNALISTRRVLLMHHSVLPGLRVPATALYYGQEYKLYS